MKTAYHVKKGYNPQELADFSFKGLNDETIEELVKKFPPFFRYLRLSDNSIGDRGVQAIANHLPPTLERLYLGTNSLGRSGFERLVAQLPQSLGLLDVGFNNIELTNEDSYDSGEAVKKLPADLKVLNIRQNGLGDKGAEKLATMLPPGLERLHIGHNKISHVGIKAFGSFSCSLTSLALGGNDLGDEGVKVLAQGLPNTLRKLTLGENGIGDEGAIMLAMHMPKSLVRLSLYNNNIGGRAADILIKSLPRPFHSLDLGNNRIDSKDIKVLAQHLPALNRLMLKYGNIDDAGDGGSSKGAILGAGRIGFSKKLYKKWDQVAHQRAIPSADNS